MLNFLATIIDKSSETLSKKDPFRSTSEFSMSNFDISTPFSPFQCCNQVKVSTERIATLKRGRGGVGYQQKICFSKLRKNADRKRLFCSSVSTLLSMIVPVYLFHLFLGVPGTQTLHWKIFLTEACKFALK